MTTFRGRRSGAVMLAAAFAIATPRGARAQGTGNEQLAQALFDEAKKLMAENNYAAACPKLAESQHLDPSGGTILHLGICHENQGKSASAYTELNQALSIAKRDGRSDREKVAKAHIDAVAPKLVRLMVTVPPEARVAGLEITWNGTPLPEAQWGLAFPVDPGEHVVSAQAPGKRKWSTRVDVSLQMPTTSVAIPALPGEPGRADAVTPPAVAAPSPPAAPDDDRRATESTGSTTRILGLGLAGAGVIALGVGIGFEAKALSLASERDDAAKAGDATTTFQKHDDAKSAQTIAFLVGGAGIAALGGGLILFFTAPHGERKLAVVPSVSPTSGGLAVTGPLSF